MRMDPKTNSQKPNIPEIEETECDALMAAVENLQGTPREKRIELIAIQQLLSRIRMRQLDEKSRCRRKQIPRKRTNFGWIEKSGASLHKWGKKRRI